MALNFTLKGTQQFLSGKEHFYEENVNLHWNLAKGTTSKAQGTMTVDRSIKLRPITYWPITIQRRSDMRARMLGTRGRVVQKGIGEAHVFLLTRASWAEPNGSVYCTCSGCCGYFWDLIVTWRRHSRLTLVHQTWLDRNHQCSIHISCHRWD